MGSVRNFSKTITQYKMFNSSLKTIKNRHGIILMEPKEKADRWKEYFTELLNADILDNSKRRKNLYGAESMVSEVTQEEIYEAIKDLKNWKSPGSDEIPAEFIKYGGKKMQNLLFRICRKIWKDKNIPKSWNEAIVEPIYKKGDKSICENYRGISLLNSAYKVFAIILLKRLISYADENLGRYQCGFRKGKSTIEQLTIIGQIIEKKYEFLQNIWQLFVDFKKAYDSIHRQSLYNILEENSGFHKN
jgi:hypothetical protein